MLVLTRKVDQAIVIQGNILITVVGVERDRVKIGITAPQEITVLRQELLNQERNGDATSGQEPTSQEEVGSEESEPSGEEGRSQ
jgi:carbon storage regulator